MDIPFVQGDYDKATLDWEVTPDNLLHLVFAESVTLPPMISTSLFLRRRFEPMRATPPFNQYLLFRFPTLLDAATRQPFVLTSEPIGHMAIFLNQKDPLTMDKGDILATLLPQFRFSINFVEVKDGRSE